MKQKQRETALERQSTREKKPAERSITDAKEEHWKENSQGTRDLTLHSNKCRLIQREHTGHFSSLGNEAI